jgi:hypothetical protein
MRRYLVVAACISIPWAFAGAASAQLTCADQCAITEGQCQAGCGSDGQCHNTCSSNEQLCLAGCPPPPSVSLTANPTTVASGQATYLSWTTSIPGATCTPSADPPNSGWSGSLPASGNKTVPNLTVSTTFNLSCAAPAGQPAATATATPVPVTVIPCESQCENEAASCHAGCGSNPACHAACDVNLQTCRAGCAPVTLQASYVPALSAPRTTYTSTSSNPPSFNFYYNQSLGNFEQRPGGACNTGQNNSTYLMVRYVGPPMQGCSFQASWDAGPVTCTPGQVAFLNSSQWLVLDTDVFGTDPSTCALYNPQRNVLPFNQLGWFNVNLSIAGQTTTRRLNFVKPLVP